MATTIEEVMQLDVVDPTNANAYWTQVNGPLWPEGRFRFSRTGNPGPIAGRGLMTFTCPIPKNLAGTPAWNIVLHHIQASGDASNNPNAGARVLLRVDAKVLASGDTPAAPTVLVPNSLIGCGQSGDFNITVLSATNFDSALALVAGNRLRMTLMRMPHGSSGDSVVGHWDLNYPPVLRCDVA